MAGIEGFDRLWKEGTPEEKKELIGLFVDRIEVDPDKRTGKIYMKKFPMST